MSLTPYYEQDGLTIYCGECGQIMEDVLDDNSVDLTVTSPIYDNLRDYNGYTFDFEAIAQQLWRVTKKGGVVVWVVGDATIDGSETLTSFKQAIRFREIGFNVHDTMIWHKRNPIPGKSNRYTAAFEYMFIFSKEGVLKFSPLKQDLTKQSIDRQRYKKRNRFRVANGETKPQNTQTFHKQTKKQNVWSFSSGTGNTSKDRTVFAHPATFPEALAYDHILSWSNPDDIVLDPMLGSGTTIKMAQALGRQGIGIDISEDYCRIAVERLRQPSFFSIPSNGRVKTETKPKQQMSLF